MSSGRFISTKRAAFHSLLAKLRLALDLLVARSACRCPGLLPVARVKRRASAPYSSMTSRGSMPLPRALGHLAALGIPHEAVDKDGVEGRLAHVLDAREDHPGHPEEDDVIAGDQGVGGVEVLQVLAVCVRPAQGGEGPQGGGEPGVQGVGVLVQMGAAALGAGVGRLFGHDGLAAVVRSTRRGCGGPTTAGGRCTSPGCSPSS